VFKLLGNKRLFIMLIGLVCFIALMGLTLERWGVMIWPAQFVKDTVSWTQGLLYRPAAGIAGFFQDIRDLRVIYHENKVLRETLSKYAKDTARLNELEAENRRLKEALAFTERQKSANNYRYRIAKVISQNLDPYNETILINLGEKDGIRENMAVVTSDGLLGRTTAIASYSSSVQLLTSLNDTDTNTKAITATVKGKEEESFGIIESFDPASGLLIMTKIPQTDLMQVGDTVVTSPLSQVFPPGIEIGKVVSKMVGDFGIDYKAMVQPFAKFHHLHEVFVVEVPEQR